MFAVAEMREVKSAEEVAQMEDAFHIGYAMHTTAMRMCRAGVVEREIAGAIEGVAKSMGLGVSFPSIVSQHGETLHNLNSEGVLADGRLLLVDAGGENLMNYCSDHTRTYPVSGRFTAQQREIYDIVLACHDHIARIVRPGMMYMQEVHLEAYRKLAEGLVGVGLLKGSADDAVAAGAMYLFMPHGLGHGLGMDVHDCENIGERSFDYSLVAERAAQSATCLHRATWRLRPGTILSDEPGIYFIPALVDKCEAEGKFRGIVDYDLLRSRYLDFGGIRIEDDLLVTDTGCRILGDRTIPVTVEELEAVVGRSPYAHGRPLPHGGRSRGFPAPLSRRRVPHHGRRPCRCCRRDGACDRRRTPRSAAAGGHRRRLSRIGGCRRRGRRRRRGARGGIAGTVRRRLSSDVRCSGAAHGGF